MAKTRRTGGSSKKTAPKTTSKKSTAQRQRKPAKKSSSESVESEPRESTSKKAKVTKAAKGKSQASEAKTTGTKKKLEESENDILDSDEDESESEYGSEGESEGESSDGSESEDDKPKKENKSGNRKKPAVTNARDQVRASLRRGVPSDRVGFDTNTSNTGKKQQNSKVASRGGKKKLADRGERVKGRGGRPTGKAGQRGKVTKGEKNKPKSKNTKHKSDAGKDKKTSKASKATKETETEDDVDNEQAEEEQSDNEQTDEEQTDEESDEQQTDEESDEDRCVATKTGDKTRSGQSTTAASSAETTANEGSQSSNQNVDSDLQQQLGFGRLSRNAPGRSAAEPTDMDQDMMELGRFSTGERMFVEESEGIGFGVKRKLDDSLGDEIIAKRLRPNENVSYLEARKNSSNSFGTNRPQSQVTEVYVPSSTAIDNRKLIFNPLLPAEMMDASSCFSVVSYNILADCHLRRADYSYTQPQFLVQEYRHTLLMKELTYLDGDIVCLQEVNPLYYTHALLPAMRSLGYEGHFVKRTQDFWDEGEATFVKTAKFASISHQTFSLRDLIFKDIDSFELSDEVSQAAKKYLDRADVILLTEVVCKQTGRSITICNIHVVYDLIASDVQCMQVACAIKKLVERAGHDLNPHIICGDFNSEVRSPAYQLARDGYLSDVNIHRLQALENLDNMDGSSRSLVNQMWGAFQHTSSNLRSAYETVLGVEPAVTSYTNTTYNTLDYIFHSSSSIEAVGVLETLDQHVVDATGGIPTNNIPSDHLSLKAIFRLK